MSRIDVEGWQRVIQGEGKLTWDLWVHPIDSSTILTASGRDTLKLAVLKLRAFFGEDFLEKCRGKDHPVFSMFLMPGNDVRTLYLSLLDIFVRIRLLEKQPKFHELRNTLRSDKSWTGWGHAFLQMEVAGLALRRGWDTAFEPELPSGRKADLTVWKKDQSAMFELVQMGTDHNFRATEAFRDKLEWKLTEISRAHSVSIRGDCYRILNEKELEDLLGQVDGMASQLDDLGALKMYRSNVVMLTVTKTEYMEPPFLSGPPTQSDDWARLEARIQEKARQTVTGSAVWIRLDGLSGLWYFTVWARHGLRDKLKMIAPLCQAVLRRYDHVAGIVLSNRWAWQTGQPEETVCADGNFALRRRLNGVQERETLIIRRDKSAHKFVDEITSWYSQEPSWLDWALRKLELPQADTLFRVD